MVNRWLNNLQSVLFPPVCLLCGLRSHGQLCLCQGCQDELPWLDEACNYCATPLPVAGICGRCLQSPPAFDRSRVAFQYATPVDFLLRRLKFDGKLMYARLLGQIMAQLILKDQQQSSAFILPDVIVPVPLHPRRLRERGFNQSLEIARWISRAVHVPIDFSSCQRVRETKTQSLLPLKQRRLNIRQAFTVDKKFQARRVAIVDDVMTTAFTVQELANAMRHSGVEEIEVWCCARVSLK